ncbi:MAG: diaminopimelate epimerase [Bacteroidales bacterium]|nr:diaminopimelate epimerase [Bacteroidales bacterium]
MNILFEKYHGSGNDFIMIDARDRPFSGSPDIIADLCDRHSGIGADGLILLKEEGGFDFSMQYFNADGHEAGMCGNGGRCISAYAHKLGLFKKKTRFLASDGEHRAIILSENGNETKVKLKMKAVTADDWDDNSIFLDTGSPHYVLNKKNIAETDVVREGKRLRNDNRFAAFGGTNVDFIEEIGGILNIRTYERGVEAETLSCGTGVTAAALAWSLKQDVQSPVQVNTPGGELKVYFEKNKNYFDNIWLEGPACFVFRGEIEIKST